MSQQAIAKKSKHSMSIRSKFLLMLLGISIFSISIIGFQGLYNGHKSLTDGIKQQLSILRTSRAKQLENYFQQRRNQINMLADNTMIINAIDEFSAAFSLLDSYNIKLDEKQKNLLADYYNKEFFLRLKNENGKQNFYNVDDYLPKSLTGKYLQYHYIANNPHKAGKKEELNNAKDNSYYSKVHQKYHPKLRKFIKTFAYDDLFLIDKDSKNIIYSTYKAPDFATSLNNDIQAQSTLAYVVNAILRSPDKGKVAVVDFSPYISSADSPASFLATPVYNGNKFIGILAMQISIDQITTIINANRSWRESALGETGDIYLVGPDYKMRSNSRFVFENKENYIKNLNSEGVDAAITKKIASSGRTALLQPVDTVASRAALKGETDIQTITNYQGHEVLSAYQPVKIPGLNWAILAEINKDEATEPVVQFQKRLLISAVIQAALISFFSLWLAGRFIGPIKSLIGAAKRVHEGDTKTPISLERNDEFGELAHSFDDMRSSIHTQKNTIIKCEKALDKLLLNAFPVEIGRRYMQGEKNIANSYQNVAILYTALKGLEESVNGLDATEAIARLNELVDAFDEAAQIHDVERITTVGDSYLAVCGLTNPRLDYAARCVAFGYALFDIIDRFNIQYGTEYKLRIGISAGDINAGVVGNHKAVYDLWGKSLNIASRIRYTAELDCMRISEPVYHQLTDTSLFKQCDLINMKGVGQIATYEYHHIPVTQHSANEQG